jgi:hypothetical protein
MKTGYAFRIRVDCSNNFTKYNSSIKEEKFKEITSAHPAVSVLPVNCYAILGRRTPASLSVVWSLS